MSGGTGSGSKSRRNEPLKIEISESTDWIYDNTWGYRIKKLISEGSNYGICARKIDDHYLMTGPEWSSVFGICDLKDKELADKRMYDAAVKKAEEIKEEDTERYYLIKRKKSFPFLYFEKQTIIPEIINKTSRGKNLEAEVQKP